MPKSTSQNTFDRYYKQLNKEQKKAVDTIEGPVMVIAGPGTGKTQVLTVRVANILSKTDTIPESVLAITFTEAGVAAMRKRLSEMIGSQAYHVAIMTFHGFANHIIQQYPEEFPRIIGSKPMTDVDQFRIIETAIDTAKGLKILRPFGDRFHYVRDVVRAIQELKREGLTPGSFADVVKTEGKEFSQREDLYHEKGRFKGKMKSVHEKYLKRIEKNKELALLYAAYQDALTDQKLYDYDDMIMEALAALQTNEMLLRSLQEQYQYVSVDEHQDTNNAQNRIIEALMDYHDHPNLFIVGDEKQAIYRFQGASLENFLYFRGKYPDAKLIALTNNYRSTQTILDSAGSLMEPYHEHPTLVSQQSKGTKISVFELSTSDAELHFISENVKQRIAQGVAPEEIAVLYRTNRDALPLARMLEKAGIPFHIESDLDILADPDVRRVVQIFTAIHQFGHAESLFPVLYLDLFKNNSLDVHAIAVASAQERANAYHLISSPEELKKLSLRQPESITQTYAYLEKWKQISSNRGLLELFDVVVNDSGLLASVVARSDAVEALDKLNVFLDQIRRILENNPDATLADFMQHLARMKEHRLYIRGTLSGRRPGKVRLMTAHRSKGLEFEYVYLINCHDSNWGNRYDSQKLPLLESIYKLRTASAFTEAEDADERNLFYVALTRAKHDIVITYAKHSMDQREQLPSKFLSEIKSDLISFEDASHHEATFSTQRQVVFAVRNNSQPEIYQKEFIRDLFVKRGFAVTHLNNYLRCPWEYFFVNLLRIPQSQDKTLLYGDAVHAALQDFFVKREQDPTISKQFLLERFNFHAHHRPFAQGDREDAIERGTATLTGYYDTYVEGWHGKMLCEFKVQGIEIAPGVMLTGNIDRMDFTDSSNVATVIDYKTGRPKSRNEIEGKTRNADGSYKRQLVFYDLLLQNHKKGHYKMREGVIDFVEPDGYGKYHREVFIVQPTESQELKELILKTADEITNLKFWNSTCDREDCRFCAMRQLMPKSL
jgi:DNA helicase-2/ATP-dependent DNA helicase PcrA